jgi:hypothetical protein
MSVDQPEEPMSELEERKFEEELMRMMRGVDPPAGFAERTMARAAAAAQIPAKVMVMRPRPRPWFSGVIAAALLVGIFTEQAHLRHEREQASNAQTQFEAGMRITDRALEHTQQQLQRAGVRIGD